MSKRTDIQSRRRFLKIAATAAVAAPVVATVLPKLARAQDLPHLDESDPTAKALGYTHDASTVDKSKYPTFKAGEECSNCKFFQGKPGQTWGPCQLFPGKATNVKGWCAGYNAKA